MALSSEQPEQLRFPPSLQKTALTRSVLTDLEHQQARKACRSCAKLLPELQGPFLPPGSPKLLRAFHSFLPGSPYSFG